MGRVWFTRFRFWALGDSKGSKGFAVFGLIGRLQGLLGGPGLVISGVISPLIWVISIVPLLRTLLI